MAALSRSRGRAWLSPSLAANAVPDKSSTGDWLEPKDGSTQRMMVMPSDVCSTCRKSFTREVKSLLDGFAAERTMCE